MPDVPSRAVLVTGVLLSVVAAAVLVRWPPGVLDGHPAAAPGEPAATSAPVAAPSATTSTGTPPAGRTPGGGALPTGGPDRPSRWTAAWAAAPVAGDQQSSDGSDTGAEVSVRDVVHLSVGGTAVRLKLSNAFGVRPLPVGHATVAVAAGAATPRAQPGTLREVTFGGTRTTTIPPGADVYADPVQLAVPTGIDLLVTVYVPAPSSPVTYHPLANQDGFVARLGDGTTDADGTMFTERTSAWYYLTEVDVCSTAADGAVVALGDSITDGLGSTPDANHRWPDYLAGRLRDRPGGAPLGVLDEGLSGNRLLLDGSHGEGVNALARLDRDVLAPTGVRTVIVLEGINDIQQQPRQVDPAAITAALRQIVERAHAHGLRVIGGTLTPMGGWAGYSSGLEAGRAAVNDFVRTSGVFDGVADFDAALRDPADPLRLLPAYDSGDHIHPGDAGYRAMADAVDLAGL